MRLQPLGGRRLERVTLAGSSLGNALPPTATASLIQSRGPWLAQTEGNPVDRHDLTLIIATDAVRRSDPFTIKKDSALQAGSVATATSLAAHCAERGEGCAIIISPRDFGSFSESAFSV